MAYSIKTRFILVLAGLLVLLIATTGILIHLSTRIDNANACLRENIARSSEEHDRVLEQLKHWESVHLMTDNIRNIQLLEERFIRTRDLKALQKVLNKLFAVKQWIKLNLKDEKDQRRISNYRFLQVEMTEYEELVRFILDNPDCVIEDEEQPSPGKSVVRISELQNQANVIWEKIGFFENLAREQVALSHARVAKIQDSAAEMRSRIQDNDRQRGYIMWGMITVFAAISVSVGIFIQRTLLSPILSLTKFARKIGGGEYGITCAPPRSRELGHLANTINEMSLRIQNDIAERRRAEAIAKKEAAKLAAMISGMDEGVVFADAENAIVEVNDYFCRFMEKERNSIVGKKIEDLPLHSGKALKRILDQIAQFRGNPDSKPLVLQRPLGEAEVILRMQPIYRDRRYEGVLLNVINVTELVQARRQAEAASRELEKKVRELEESRAAVLNMMEDMEEANRVLKKTQAQLIQQEKMSSIGTLAAGVAHEFNNILTGIMGFASLARADKSKVPQLAEVVLRESERAADITRSLLSFSRQREQNLAPAGPRSLVEEVLTLVRRDFEKAGIAIETRYGETQPVLVEAGRIEQVLLNLFINALHAMERGDKFTVAVTQDGNEVVIRISDTGCGISEENLPKIFDPFFSTKGVWGKDKQAGTGLGLSVSRNIIEAHKGKIDVKSKVGMGTTFTIRLPVAEGTDGVNQVQLTRKFVHKAKDSYRVLVADDEETLRNLLAEILASLGHEATVVSSGEAALDELRKTQYDYLFLDIMMPGRYDGAAVLEKIEEMGSGVKVFVCTGKAEDENLLGLLEKAHGYVRKPFTMNEIASLLGTGTEEEEAAAKGANLG